MSKKANVSMCLIVKNEPLLEECILSFRDYVEELVIIDTGSTDGITVEIAKKYADKFEIFRACNDPQTGLIEDFSMARNRAFELATKNCAIWCDADDLITGAENISKLVEAGNNAIASGVEAVSFMLPYEYAYNENGECVCLHYRERLFINKDKFKAVNPVHEVFVPLDNVKVSFVVNEDIVYKHRRQYGKQAPETGRNLRILRRFFAKVGSTDARQMYYLGLECCNAGFVDEAIGHLSKYIDISGWDDERAMACLKLIDIYHARGDYENGLKWAFKIISIKENWGEGYFTLAKMFYHLAQNGGPNEIRNWERCIYFSKTGLNLPPTKTLLFVNPLDREYDIHRYLNVALNKCGDIKGALESCNTGLKKQPNDKGLLLNKKLFETFLVKQDAITAINKLKELQVIDQNTADLMGQFVNNQTAAPSSLPILNTKPENINTKLEIVKTDNLIGLPKDASIKSLEKYSKKKSSDKLDIIFYTGPGVEDWTPDTVKQTGIGGSELMALEMCKRLADLGHRVRIFNSCGLAGEGVYDNVEYITYDKFQNLECDVLVISRRADMLADQYNIKSKLKLLWIHDIYALNATNELLLKADRILCLSEWHKQNVINMHNVHPAHIITTRNGIDLSRFENKNINRNRFKCVNSSSPDRSWPILLSVWPIIKQQVPPAELHLYYGFKNWRYGAQFDSKQMDLINSLESKIKEMAPLGVVYHDRVSQKELSEEFLSAGVWAHPTWFTETSCITAMEAQAAGLRMITSSIAALNETVGSRGTLIDGEWTSIEYQGKFIQSTINALNDHQKNDRIELQKYAKEHFELNDLAKEWEEMFFELIESKKTNPIIPYFPTPSYKGNDKLYYDTTINNLSNVSNKQPLKLFKKPAPAVSIIARSAQPGGLNILFESLNNQTIKDFELILIDELYEYRKDIVKEKSKSYNFIVKHIAPTKNLFPISNYCNSINTGLINASSDLVLLLNEDYAQLEQNCVEKHINFHLACSAENIGCLGASHYKIMPEALFDYKDADLYALALKEGKLNNILWSLGNFDIKVLKDEIKMNSKLDVSFSEANSDLFDGNNISFKLNAALKVNGFDEEMDGSTNYQNNLFFDLLATKLNFTWMIDKTNIIYNIKSKLEPRVMRNSKINLDLWNEKKSNNFNEPINNYSLSSIRKNKPLDTLSKKPRISIIIPTNRVGGLDILFESLKNQSFQDFELILVDAIYNRRKNIVKEKSKLYNFTVKHIEPLDNTFPISNYCKSINTGLINADGELIYFTCDYAHLDKDVLLNHHQFHIDNPEKNKMLMMPVNACEFDHKHISNNFPQDKRYGTRGQDAKYQLLTVPEIDYVSAHNKWSEDYAEDISNGKLDDVLWSIFEQQVSEHWTIENIINLTKIDDKLDAASKETATSIFSDLCCLKNDSFKKNFLIEANGMEEELDGSHGFQDTEMSRRLKNLYNGQFYALNKCPVSVINTRYYLEPRKIVKGYNNIKIIDKKWIHQEPLKNNTITQYKSKKDIILNQNDQ